MTEGMQTERRRFARAVRRYPDARVVRSITFGPGYSIGGRLLVLLPEASGDLVGRRLLLDDLHAPPPVREVVLGFADVVGTWSVGLDTTSRRSSLRIYGDPDQRRHPIAGTEGAEILGIKWSDAAQEPLITCYRPAGVAMPADDRWGAATERALAPLLTGATKRLVVNEPATLRCSIDTAVDDVTVSNATPVLLDVAAHVRADSDELAQLLDRDAEAAIRRIAFGTDRMGEVFVTIYYRRGYEVVSTGAS